MKQKKLVSQGKDKTCLACCLAMIVDETEEYILDWFKEYGKPPTSIFDAFIFLAHHGVFLANGIWFVDGGGGGLPIKADEPYETTYTLNEHFALIIVDSPDPEISDNHAVFWDGSKVLDPSRSEPQPLDNYFVRLVFPMMFTNQSFYNKELKTSMVSVDFEIFMAGRHMKKKHST